MTDSVEKVETPSDDVEEVRASDQKTEALIPQSKVNEIAAKARQTGREQALKQLAEQSVAAAASSSEPSSGADANAHLSAQDVEAMIEEAATRKAQAAQEQAQQQQAYEIGQHLYTSFKDAEENLPGFKDITKDVDLTAMPDVLGLLYENAKGHEAHALFELLKNPMKLGNLRNLVSMSPNLAAREVQNLVGSIARNEEAKAAPRSPQPLSQLDGSALGVDSGGNRVKDLRKKPAYSW